MIIYSGNKIDFMESVANDTITIDIERNILEKMHRKTGEAELRSWTNSLKYMYIALNSNTIPEDAGIAIEYNIPPTGKRVDFMISGYDESNNGNIVIIELKQWDKITPVEGQEAIVRTFVAGANRDVAHPSYQAWSYATLINDYNSTVQESSVNLYPCAYLHNYLRKGEVDPIDAPQYGYWTERAPVFSMGDMSKIRAYIEKLIKRGDNQNLIFDIDHGKIRPSKKLQDVIASMLKSNDEFTLIDEQKVVYENALMWAKESMRDGQKRVIVVEGGPGTGKTVVAINLLAKLTNAGQYVQYTSKNSAPRAVYKEKLRGEIKSASIDNLFVGPGSYVDVPKNCVDTIIVDEAHRLNDKSGMFRNLGENQIKEIINASKCAIFFIDESQRVTTYDIGSIDEIEKWANAAGAVIHKTELISQFRCNGSDGYLAWLDDVLEIRETANYSLEGIDYDIRILNTPNEVRDLIKMRNAEKGSARILAGYCWEWPKASRSDSNSPNIVIGDDFAMSWNLDGGKTYATDPNSINEVGCIHTTQGLEFDYVGVIIGEDMRYEGGHIVTDFTRRAKTDQSLKGIKSLYKEDPAKAEAIADEIIKNTYRTLMTRGMKGCYVYCCDERLAEYLKKRLRDI